MRIVLPTWQETEDREGRAGSELTSVERFVNEYEPTAGAAEWREALIRALESVCGA